ncbi:MAG: hypothetical protein ACYC92_07910 [Candidatus Acidiferrales bacterium]
MKWQRYILIALLLVVAVEVAADTIANWQRIVLSGKGESTDNPAAHSLSYFTANPFLRDDGGDLCVVCTPAGRAKAEQRYIITSEVQHLGNLAGFPVVQILYRVGPRRGSEPAQIRWKFLLVQTGKDLYREIYHLQAYYVVPPLESAKIVKVGDEQVLATYDSVGGNGGFCWDAYWWFDSSGPHRLDFSRVKAAITRHVPPGATFWTTCWALHLDHEEIESTVQKIDPRCHACGMLGEVTAHFRLEGSVAVPVGVRYRAGFPNADAH